jgi:O-antigen ligase
MIHDGAPLSERRVWGFLGDCYIRVVPPDDAAHRHAERRPSLADDPVALVVGLALVGVVPIGLYAFGLPRQRVEWITGLVVMLFFLLTVVRSPANGVALLYLVPPLFNGEDAQPYFWLLEVFVYATLAAGLGIRLWRRRPFVVPHAPLLLFFLATTVASVPLTLEELWLQIQVSPWREVLEVIRRADLAEDLFYVRTVFNVTSGLALVVLVVNERWSRQRVTRLAVAATLVYTATAVVGLWCYWRPPGLTRTFLTLWVGGDSMGGFQGLGFNVAYFAQYALAYLPLMVLVLVESTAAWTRAMAMFGLLVTAYTIPATRQRAAFALFALELTLLLASGAIWWWRTRSVRWGMLAGAVAGVVATSVGLLAFTAVGPDALRRVEMLRQQGDPYRVTVLSVARRMFLDEPVLGIGSGRFAGEFTRYYPDPAMHVGSLSAHNLYAQFLAEQGVVGLASFLALLTVVVLGAVRTLRGPSDARTVLALLLTSLGIWLAYGAIQHTFLMRSMQVYFWITAGLLVALARPTSGTRRWRPWLLVLAVILILGAVRVHAVLRRPIPIGYSWGFHAGDPAHDRWTRGGAIMNLPAQGRTLTLAFAFPVITARPQRVTVLVDGVEIRRLAFRSPSDWSVVEVPIDKPRGAPVLVQVRVAYSIVPADLGVYPDSRHFGVVMKAPSWH